MSEKRPSGAEREVASPPPRGMAKPRPRPPGAPPAMVMVQFKILPTEVAEKATILVYGQPVAGGQKFQVGYPTRVVVKAPGYATYDQKLTVAQETTLTIELKKHP